jgi:DNA-binding XRE family transcriptional regulator
MPKQGLNLETTPATVTAALARLGANLCLARKRRALTQADLARKAGITTFTLKKVEKGSPTTSIAAYLTLLWTLGLEQEFSDLASPDRDEEGKALERARSPERVRAKPSELDDDF